jgi:hypothetical protein
MPDGTTQSEQLQLLAIFDCDQQDQLATRCLHDDCIPRALLVVATPGSHTAITNVQQIVEEDVELTRTQ